MTINLPDFDAKTWAILGLLAALLIVVLATPTLRENLATWVVWLWGLFFGVAREHERRQDTPPKPQEVDPATTADDADDATQAAVEQEAEPTAEEIAQDINEMTEEAEP